MAILFGYTAGSEAGMIATGQQIRAARAALGWSREDLAERAGFHPKCIAYWENMTDAPRRHSRARAPERILAVLREAGIDIVAAPRPAVIFGRPRLN